MTKNGFDIVLRGGKYLCFDAPQVMGIVNVTPDSFYAGSRATSDDILLQKVSQMLSQGATMIDVGAFSTRPGHADVSADEEMSRLDHALSLVAETIHQANALISVDTFRPEVAEQCVLRWNADIINDVSGGCDAMFEVVNRLKVPYILMDDTDNPAATFARQLPKLKTSVILDPGYGFGKDLDRNYQLMADLPNLIREFSEYPMLVGISRKSMIWRLLDITPDEALNGTTVLNTVALLAGTHILRVHDVTEAMQCVTMINHLSVPTRNHC